MNLPDAQTYFNDPIRKTGGYYIEPQLGTMLNPPSNTDDQRTLPLVVLGGPARDEWNKITKQGAAVLTTGVERLSSAPGKATPFILGNHPDVTTYQCCLGDTSPECTSNNLIEMEEIDFQVVCWVKSMSAGPDQDPSEALEYCKEDWVTDRSVDDDLKFCAQARIDSNECFGKDIDWQTAINYCKANGNNACATYACP